MNYCYYCYYYSSDSGERGKYARRPIDQLFLDLDGRSPHGTRGSRISRAVLDIDTKLRKLSKTRGIQVEGKRRGEREEEGGERGRTTWEDDDEKEKHVCREREKEREEGGWRDENLRE